MLYALTRADGSVAMTCVLPKEVISGGKTLPVTFVDGAGKKLTAVNEHNENVYFILPTDDMRSVVADSIPNVTLTFYDITKIIENYPDPIVSYAEMTVDDVPTTRAYRNAWAVSGTTITHDMAKARDLHRVKLREERKPLLEVLDVAYQRADEQDDGPLKRRIAAEKQKLRDITSNRLIEQAANVEALAPLTVEYLLAHP